MSTSDAELLVGLLKSHLVRMLRVAPALQMLDFTTFAIQVHERPLFLQSEPRVLRSSLSQVLYATLLPLSVRF